MLRQPELRHSTPFASPPPPSRATASRRWIFTQFDSIHITTTSAGSGFMASRRRSHLHLPRMQQRAGGGFYSVSTLFGPHHLPRMQQASRRWIFTQFDTIHIATTSAGGGFMASRRHPHLLHLPRMQQQAGGGFLRNFDTVHITTTSLACKQPGGGFFTPFRHRSHYHHLSWRWTYGVSAPFTPPLPPSHATVSRRWILCCFDAVRTTTTSVGGGFMASRHRSHLLHLPRMQQRAGGGFYSVSTLFGPHHLPRMQQASRRWFFYAVFTLFAPPPPRPTLMSNAATSTTAMSTSPR